LTKKLVWKYFLLVKKMNKYIVIDFETTGFNGIKDEIIEIGAIKVVDHQIIDSLSILVKANSLLPQKIIDITHITDGMLAKQGISKIEAAQRLYSFLDDDAIIVGYNVMFDISFLIPFIQNNVDSKFSCHHDILDVLTVFRDLYPGTHKLGDAVSHFHINEKNTHRALDDVISTWEVMKAIRNDYEAIDDRFKNVIGYQPTFGYRQLKLPQLMAIPHRPGQKDIYISRKFQ